jgi:hypothetical protein
LEFIEDYDHSYPTQLTDGGGHGWEVDDRVGESSDVLQIGLTETAAKGRGDVPLVGIGSLHVNELGAEVVARAGEMPEKGCLPDPTPALDSTEEPVLSVDDTP